MNIDISKEERAIILQLFNDVEDKWSLNEKEIILQNKLQNLQEVEKILEQIPETETETETETVSNSLCDFSELLDDDYLSVDSEFIITEEDIKRLSLDSELLNKKYKFIYDSYKELCDDYGKNKVTEMLCYDIHSSEANGLIEEIKEEIK